MPDITSAIAAIKQKSSELGFLECGIVRVEYLAEEQTHFEKWLANGMHGEMCYMARNADKRLNPALLFENAKTVIVVLQNYFPDQIQTVTEAPVLSKYAYGTDYHLVMKEKLNQLLQFIIDEVISCKGRAFVDSAPVLERAWARRAGLGWVGKNSNLISLEHGSFFFIGELVIDVEIADAGVTEIRDHCGTCTRCVEACPTGAIVGSRKVDARRCIAYQTIELKGELDAALNGKFENRVFGCDICQDVCPWNLKSKPHHEPAFQPDKKLLELTPDDWHNMEKPVFKALFRDSAVNRTGYDGLMRNLKFLQNNDRK